MLKMYKEEYDRLMETSPIINDDMIVLFKKSFKASKTYVDVKKPEICDDLVPTISTVYKEPLVLHSGFELEQPKTPDIDRVRAEMAVAKFRETNLKAMRDRKILEDFMIDFQKVNNRRPVDTEIITNLKEKVDAEILKKIINS